MDGGKGRDRQQAKVVLPFGAEGAKPQGAQDLALRTRSSMPKNRREA